MFFSVKYLIFSGYVGYLLCEHIRAVWVNIGYYKSELMVLSDAGFRFFAVLQAQVRSALVQGASDTPFQYEGERFFEAYSALQQVWLQRQSQRQVAASLRISRSTLSEWEDAFVQWGSIGLLQLPPAVVCDAQLERLVVLVKSARPHAGSSAILTLAQALKLPGATVELIRRIQRSYGYGQRLDEKDIHFFAELQKILASVEHYRTGEAVSGRDIRRRANTFFDFDRDPLQHKLELFKALASCSQKRQVRPLLEKFGIHSSRFYALKQRYLVYGIWGLVDLVHSSRRRGEKISADLELKIIEQRLMNPKLSTRKIIEALDLRCSRANVQKIYSRWGLSAFRQAVPIRGVLSSPIPQSGAIEPPAQQRSARARFPDLVQTANLKVNRVFTDFLKTLSRRSVPISNPGALILAPFLDQLGIVEALHTYGPATLRTTDISNDILVNVLRILAGFPTINSYMHNSDRSVAIGAGVTVSSPRSQFYRQLDELRFSHLQQLRNDLALRAKELHIIEGKEIAIDYHCDPSDSRYPHDRGQSKAPDKNGDVVYAHRPQLLWDSSTNSIINIAYCEGRSRAPSALYRFLEDNLFAVIDRSAIAEIYADSEYTGERQLVYLHVRVGTSITMCLKQNKKIKKWKEEALQNPHWQPYEEGYRITSQDHILAETGKRFRFVVKQNIETNEIRCFGSTHTELSPAAILDRYHMRWSVETGIKDLIENYFLNKPTGNAPEKVEAHYYCVMIGRLLIDYFRSILDEPRWKTEQGWESVLSTIRTTVFSNQNCELNVDDAGDLQVTYLDGDPVGIKANIRDMLQRRKSVGLNTVPWWGGRGVSVRIEDRFQLGNGPGSR